MATKDSYIKEQTKVSLKGIKFMVLVNCITQDRKLRLYFGTKIAH